MHETATVGYLGPSGVLHASKALVDYCQYRDGYRGNPVSDSQHPYQVRPNDPHRLCNSCKNQLRRQVRVRGLWLQDPRLIAGW